MTVDANLYFDFSSLLRVSPLIIRFLFPLDNLHWQIWDPLIKNGFMRGL